MFLKNDKLVKLAENDLDEKAYELIRSGVAALENLCQQYGSFPEKWKDENAVETLLVLSEKFKNKDDFQLMSYVILANIVDDDEINKLQGIVFILIRNSHLNSLS